MRTGPIARYGMRTSHECEEHGWMKDRADPHARERAFEIASLDPPSSVTAKAAATAIAEMLDGIGDTCPDARRTTTSGAMSAGCGSAERWR
jgi:hypothetical protein